MRLSKRIFFGGVMSLTAILVMVTALPVQAEPTPDHASMLAKPQALQSGTLLLAQKTEPVKEKQPSPAPPPKEPKALKTMGTPPSPQMERMEKRGLPDDPGKAGTKKIGGQAIRAKETPGGE